MQQQLLPTGRVSYFPMCEYQGDRHFRTFSGDHYEVNVKRRIVDTTYMKVTVPSMRPPPYHVVPEIRCVPPNELPNIRQRCARYVIIGAGKTAMDTCQWLLWYGIDPADITWVRPRDSWLINRVTLQFGAEFADCMAAGISAENQAIMEATSIDDLFERLVASERLLRLDDNVRPTMFRCAVVSPMEFDRVSTCWRIGPARDGVEEPGDFDVIVDADPGKCPIGILVVGVGERSHRRPLDGFKQLPTADPETAHHSPVQLHQYLGDRCIAFGEREETSACATCPAGRTERCGPRPQLLLYLSDDTAVPGVYRYRSVQPWRHNCG